MFITKRMLDRFQATVNYYQYDNIPARLSKYLQSSYQIRKDFENRINNTSRSVEIIAYCIMPNHYHLILRQLINNGISRYVANIQNSITKYFNVRENKNGHLFQGQFKSVLVEDDNQLIHLQRYIHLNPYSSGIVATQEKLMEYPYSSLPEYLGITKGFCDKDLIYKLVGKSSRFKDFIFDHADYQKRLEGIKHLIIEK